MVELEDYYRELILDHSRSPRNRGKPEHWTHCGESTHSAKGDCMTVFMTITNNQHIENIAFVGDGSAVALASASLMTSYLKTKTTQEALEFTALVKAMMYSTQKDEDYSALEDVASLAGVRQFPARIDCALLAWNAFENALKAKS